MWDIQVDPNQFRVDFDFQNQVVILQTKEQRQTIIVAGSSHSDERSIAFGKQLIETFKPKTVLVEDGPLQTKLLSSEGEPRVFELVKSLVGSEF